MVFAELQQGQTTKKGATKRYKSYLAGSEKSQLYMSSAGQNSALGRRRRRGHAVVAIAVGKKERYGHCWRDCGVLNQRVKHKPEVQRRPQTRP